MKRLVETAYAHTLPKSEEFSRRIRAIQALPLQEAMDFLEVKSVFRLQREGSTAFGYPNSVNELNKLQFTAGPSEKLRAVVRAVAWMKMAVLEFHRTQVELSSMDDELPLLILVLTRIHPGVRIERELAIMSDYLRFHEDWDFEEKHFRNVSVS